MIEGLQKNIEDLELTLDGKEQIIETQGENILNLETQIEVL